MSEPIFIAGVVKFNHRLVGYPEILSIAQKWAQDAKFVEVIIRGTSEKDYGIQFVYEAMDDPHHNQYDEFSTKYLYPLKDEKRGEPPQSIIYAYDVNFKVESQDIIVLKSLPKIKKSRSEDNEVKE